MSSRRNRNAQDNEDWPNQPFRDNVVNRMSEYFGHAAVQMEQDLFERHSTKNAYMKAMTQYLATWSKYFNNLFYGEFAEKDKKEFKIEGVDAKEFTELLRIIHLCLVTNIRDYNVLFLLKLAAHFEMPSVVSMCGIYLFDLDNAPDVSLMLRLELADQHKILHLQVAVLKTIEGLDLVERQKFFDKYLNRIKNLSNDTLKHLTRF